MFRRLALADYATLVGLGLGWTAVSLFLRGDPGAATLTLLLAFLCDKADGCLARRGYGSPLGAHLDALADVVIYLVPAAVVVSDLLTGSAVFEISPGRSSSDSASCDWPATPTTTRSPATRRRTTGDLLLFTLPPGRSSFD